MQARRLLGIERAVFNYDTEPEKEEKPPRHSRKNPPTANSKRRQELITRRLQKKKKLAARQQSALLGDADHPHPQGRDLDHQEHQLDEFNVDSIECLVDNEPVEDGESVMRSPEEHGMAFSCPHCHLR